MSEFKKYGLYYIHQDRKRVAVMLIGKVRMIYLLTVMLAVGAGAGFASHEDAMSQVQAAEEAALEENTQTMGYSTGSMEKEYNRQCQTEEELTETLEKKETSGADTEELDNLKGQIRNVQLQQQILKARMEAQG